MIRKRRTSRNERPIELFLILKVIWDTLHDPNSQKTNSDRRHWKDKNNMVKSSRSRWSWMKRNVKRLKIRKINRTRNTWIQWIQQLQEVVNTSRLELVILGEETENLRSSLNKERRTSCVWSKYGKKPISSRTWSKTWLQKKLWLSMRINSTKPLKLHRSNWLILKAPNFKYRVHIAWQGQLETWQTKWTLSLEHEQHLVMKMNMMINLSSNR